jgi:ABC-2 type transport system permease protein
MSAQVERESTVRTVTEEARKLSAFLRRDLLISWSYRLPFITDWFSLILQTLIFVFVGRLIPPDALPVYDGRRVEYLEFVAVGITLSSFLAVGLTRLMTAIRQEQVQGTLESLVLTPTAWTTLQLGSAVYDVLYVPIRTVVFLSLTVLFFGASYTTSGVPAAIVVLLAFIPFVWGLGILSAAATLTFRRGSGGVGFFVTIATLGSGAYFPLYVLPEWVQTLAAYNPMAIAVTAMRDALLGGARLADVADDVLKLIPMSLATLAVGAAAFRAALARERRQGTLGLY